MIPLLIGKALLTVGKAIAVEVGAKKLIEKFSKSDTVTNRLNTQCRCSGFYMLPDDIQDKENGLVVCNKCSTKVAQHLVTEKE